MKYPGVSRDTRGHYWQARIGMGRRGQRKHLGYFPDWWDAVCARKAAENLFAPVRRVNVVRGDNKAVDRFLYRAA